jgi:hypothetical protein
MLHGSPCVPAHHVTVDGHTLAHTQPLPSSLTHSLTLHTVAIHASVFHSFTLPAHPYHFLHIYLLSSSYLSFSYLSFTNLHHLFLLYLILSSYSSLFRRYLIIFFSSLSFPPRPYHFLPSSLSYPIRLCRILSAHSVAFTPLSYPFRPFLN